MELLEKPLKNKEKIHRKYVFFLLIFIEIWYNYICIGVHEISKGENMGKKITLY